MAEPSGRTPRGGPGARRRPRANLSMESIVSGAIDILDREGSSGLTFRALAASLGGGVGSIYWYVKNKDELLSYATDAVVGRVRPTVDRLKEADPFEGLREICLALFEQMEAHPWAATHLMRDLQIQENAMYFWEGLGGHLLRLDLTDRQSFQAVSALVNYVVGMGAQMAVESFPEPEPGEDPEMMRDRYLDEWANTWLEQPIDQFPFAHKMAPIFRQHDDFEQFVGGLDLMLAGIRLQHEHQ